MSNPIRTIAQFRDDGLNGDVLANDGVFIARGTTTWTTAGQKSLVVQSQQVFGQPLLIATLGIEVVAKRPDAEWDVFFDTLDAAGAQFEQLKSRLTIVEAQFELLNWLENQPGVAQVRLIDQPRIEIDYDSGLSNSIWVEDPENATLGASNRPSPNTSLASSIEPEPIADRMLPVANTAPIFTNSNRAIILNSLPSGNTVANTSVPNVRAYLQAARFTVEVYQQADARIPLYKQLDQYGVIHTIGHGYYTGVANRYTITTGHLATAAAQSEYRADIDAKNISVDIKDGKTLLNTTIRFYQTYYKGKTFPNSLWSLIHCNSAEETDLSSLLIGKGVKGYVGFDGLIPNDPGWTWGADGPNSLYKIMGKQGFDLGTAFNSIPANQKEIVYNLLTPVVGTTTQHTYLRLAAGSSENLKLSSHGFTNGNFEAGSLLGWSHRTGVWANAFAVPSWAQPNHGLYAGHIGKMIYPPECGTCNPIPMTNELFQYVDLLSSTKFLRFDYAYSTYLPSSGWIEVSLQSPSNGAILATYRLAQYPGSGTRGASDFWYTDIRSSKIDIRTALNQSGFKGQSIRVNFHNIQQNGNAQTFYLDNVRIADF
ncbi:hypothetical protein [Herpetosiphon gulosus]|uniref:Uncharacterized protein n=1 Tax=Herpetosiphon gulosus TaxID=1973496 RepID=A0ABP9X560_9CHLR